MDSTADSAAPRSSLGATASPQGGDPAAGETFRSGGSGALHGGPAQQRQQHQQQSARNQPWPDQASPLHHQQQSGARLHCQAEGTPSN